MSDFRHIPGQTFRSTRRVRPQPVNWGNVGCFAVFLLCTAFAVAAAFQVFG